MDPQNRASRRKTGYLLLDEVSHSSLVTEYGSRRTSLSAVSLTSYSAFSTAFCISNSA